MSLKAPAANHNSSGDAPDASPPTTDHTAGRTPATSAPLEIGGPKGPEPTRYGDWEMRGRCIDF